jgi:mono/diheme cytochrome c family protein
MRHLTLAEQRRFVGLGFLVCVAVATYWVFFSNGVPVVWGPSASAAEIAAGRELFEHQWQPNDPLAHGDGLGPVFNARSCATCHFQGGLGGGGNLEHNAVNYEVHSRPSEPTFLTGTIHNFSIDPAYQESRAKLRKLHPVIKGRTETITGGDDHCRYTTTITIPDFDPVRTDSVQTTALFGAGWIDLISDKAIKQNRLRRVAATSLDELKLDFTAIPVGRLRTVSGGVGKFGWKAQFARLEDFVAAACANELGLGTPKTAQAKPFTADTPDVEPDLNRKQFRSLVAFVKTLPKPVEILPDSLTEQAAAARGQELFATIGCSACHVPDIGGVKGVYSDFLLYSLDDPIPPGGSGGGGPYNEPPPELQLAARPRSEPRPDEWKTPPLWGVADSAPYLHDGSAPTLRDAILRHRGDARLVSDAYQKLDATDQAAVISFLKTLKAPPDALPLRDPSVTRLTKR